MFEIFAVFAKMHSNLEAMLNYEPNIFIPKKIYVDIKLSILCHFQIRWYELWKVWVK